MFKNRIPTGPWDNGLYQDGDYDAIVHKIERCKYKKKGGVYFRIMLWLPSAKRFIATNIYACDETAKTALQRVWHFCQACRLSEKDFIHRLGEFERKHIVIRIKQVSAAASGAESAFSDVDLFLRPTSPLSYDALNEYCAAVNQKAGATANIEPEQKTAGKLDLFAV